VTVSATDEAQARPGTWTRVRRDALGFDPAGISVRVGLRMALGTTAALAIGYAAGSWASGAAAAGGALAVGVASVVPSPRPRFALMAATAATMATGTFVGSATSGHAALHIVVAALFTFTCGLLMAVQPSSLAVGVNALVAFLVYGRFAEPPAIALHTGLLVAAGGVGQLLLVRVARFRPRISRGLASAARLYETLAGYAGRLDGHQSFLPIGTAIDVAATDIDLSLATPDAVDAWRSLLSEAGRLRLEFLSLSGAIDNASPSVALPLTELGESAGRFLALVAEGLGSASVPAGVGDALADVQRRIIALQPPEADADALSGVRALAAAQALGGQLRAIAGLLPDAVSLRRPEGLESVLTVAHVSRRSIGGLEGITERMLANLTVRSDAFQHALRLAVVVAVGTALAHVVDLSRGYWLTLTAVLVLRPEFSATFTRGLSRAVGTFVGVGVATAFATTIRPHGWVLVAFVGVFVWAAGALFNASYAVFSVFVTGVVVFLLAGIDPDPVTTARDRLIATVLGAALALISYVAWPTWGRRKAGDALADLADVTHRYVDLVLRGYLDPRAAAPAAALTAASRAVRLARTNAESAVERSLNDPSRRRVDVAMTAAVLAACRRQSIAAHTLRLRQPTVESALPIAALRVLVTALDIELGGIAAGLRFGRVIRQHEPLRELHQQLAAAVADPTNPVAALLIVETDELVDATNTLTALLDQTTVAV
jgi:Fusaric acid resistance protein-like